MRTAGRFRIRRAERIGGMDATKIGQRAGRHPNRVAHENISRSDRMMRLENASRRARCNIVNNESRALSPDAGIGDENSPSVCADLQILEERATRGGFRAEFVVMNDVAGRSGNEHRVAYRPTPLRHDRIHFYIAAKSYSDRAGTMHIGVDEKRVRTGLGPSARQAANRTTRQREASPLV